MDRRIPEALNVRYWHLADNLTAPTFVRFWTIAKWELYNIAEDYSESNDLAAKMPDKLRQLQELFLVEASKYNVFPLDNSILQRIVAPRPLEPTIAAFARSPIAV